MSLTHNLTFKKTAIALGIAALSLTANPAVNSNFDPIAVEKVENLPADFIFGMDVSSFLTEINSGVQYKDFSGKVLDKQGFFNLLKEAGTNYIRLRVFNDPKDKNGNFYGGGNNDLETAIEIGKLATNAGQKVLIDFHYSDFWADPKKQMVPKAWADLDVNAKGKACYDYTKESLEKLLKAGVDVGMAQIGNENNNGVAGEVNWSDRATIFAWGAKAIRDVSKEQNKQIKVVVHYAQPSLNYYDEVATQLNIRGVDYDVFGTSYYPYWHGDYKNLQESLTNIAEKFNKEVMVVETSYVNTLEDGDGFPNTESEWNKTDAREFKISPQGQANSLRGIVNTLANTPKAIGIMYWEPAWIPPKVWSKADPNGDAIVKANRELNEKYGSGWASKVAGSYDEKDAGQYYGGTAVDNEALFDFDGNPLPSLNTYKYILTGTDVPVVVDRTESDPVIIKYGKELVLPETARLVFNTDVKLDTPVTWEKVTLEEAKAGKSELKGSMEYKGKTYAVTTKFKNVAENLLPNPSFETKDDWRLDGIGVSIKDEQSNVRSGKSCLKYWHDSDFEFTAEQTVILNKGTYTIGGFMQGGDAGSSPVFEISVKVGEQEYKTTGQVSKWQEWYEPKLENVEVAADNQPVTLKIYSKLPAGAWGSFDDFYINKD